MRKEKGILIVLSSPSGGWKSTICRRLLAFRKDLAYSISVTTRPMRKHEVNSKHYFFVSETEFKKYIKQNKLAEWAIVHDNYYGTPRKFIREKTARGTNVIMDIDVQGSLKLMNKYKKGLFIFIVPPSMKELERRLFKRKTDTDEVIRKRLINARKEIKYIKHYDYAVVNDNLEKAVSSINCIVEAEIIKRRKPPQIK